MTAELENKLKAKLKIADELCAAARDFHNKPQSATNRKKLQLAFDAYIKNITPLGHVIGRWREETEWEFDKLPTTFDRARGKLLYSPELARAVQDVLGKPTLTAEEVDLISQVLHYESAGN